MNYMQNKKLNDEDRTVASVKIDEISFNPNHPRKCIDSKSLEDLAKSIKLIGILQPILVQKDEHGKIHLVTGERRVRAAKIAGKMEIPAIFVNQKSEAKSIIISLIENMYKTHLTPLDEGGALYQLKSEFRCSDRLLMQITGKSEKEINELLEFNNLPDNVKEFCRDIEPERVTKRKLRQISKIEDLEKIYDMGLWNLFYSRQRRYRGEIVQDKAKNLQKTLGKLDEFDFKHSGKEMKTELSALNKTVWEILHRS
jgi:ParB family chromosome partitioning protein